MLPNTQTAAPVIRIMIILAYTRSISSIVIITMPSLDLVTTKPWANPRRRQHLDLEPEIETMPRFVHVQWDQQIRGREIGAPVGLALSAREGFIFPALVHTGHRRGKDVVMHRAVFWSTVRLARNRGRRLYSSIAVIYNLLLGWLAVFCLDFLR